MREHDALAYHREGRSGKLEITPTKPLVTQRDLSLAYSPGVAEPCLEIAKDAEKVWEYTARGNLVGVITNGSAVLGLGDIGPLAGKPVMEGKACLFKKFADIDVFDIETSETDVDKFVDFVAALEPTFGGINLEDIKAPECFDIERKLKERMNIPVFHDDQHGTAIISGAGLINACRVTGRDIASVRLVVSGAGASAISCVEFFVELGMDAQNIVLVDSKGVIHDNRTDLNEYKRQFAIKDCGMHSLADAMVGADMFLGLSRGGLVSSEMIDVMAEKPIIFALANPTPEIDYEETYKRFPDAVIATGRSDYPNQVNNVLGFPYIFRGALDVRASHINIEMKIAAAKALAELTHETVPDSVTDAYGDVAIRFGHDYIIPKPFDQRVLWWVAPAVAQAAMETGVARCEIDIEEYTEQLHRIFGDVLYPVMRSLVRRAKKNPKRIVFPDGVNLKVLRACEIASTEGIAVPVLLGRKHEIKTAAEQVGLSSWIETVETIDPYDSSLRDVYAQTLYELRQRKGVSLTQARGMMNHANTFGMTMVLEKHVDGLVSGLKAGYRETMLPALQIIGIKPDVKRATGMYMMVLKDRLLFFADATVNIDPDAEILADIAIQVADSVVSLGVHPRVAMISFSNFGEQRYDETKKVKRAMNIVRDLRPDIEIDGEMQADFALNKHQMDEMYPFCRLTDAANVLVFPTLTSGNAAYKLLSSIGGARAIGPILLGIAKPVSVLPPDISVDGIVDMIAYTVRMAQIEHSE